jgi:hypothetical protein
MEKNHEVSRLLILLFIAVVVLFAFYGIFYYFSGYIWSLNAKVSLADITPWMRIWLSQKDGVETYVLYVLALADLAVVALLAGLSERLTVGKRKYAFWSAFALASFVMLFYLRRQIGFNPPMEARSSLTVALAVVALVGFLLWLIVKISGWRRWLADLLIVLGLLPVCFIATSAFSPSDYSYVFAPALRLIDHAKLSEIYFQYDLLLSLIAAAWMKLRLNLNAFQVVAQASFYALFLGSFFTSRRFFRTKKLSYYLLTALVLMKVYALMHDPAYIFQVTPFRLDLWIILFILAYERGFYSKWLGAALGLFILFHRAFGIIYCLGYFELIATLWFLDAIEWPISWRAVQDSFLKQLTRIWPNALMILSALGLSYLLFGSSLMEASSTYRRIGIGFMPIYHQSFYWYVPILFSVTFALFLKKRKLLDEKYFNGGLFLIFLAIGNSLYFFGRSHEHNIINISAVLLFVLFTLLDLVFSEEGGPARSRVGKILATALPVLLVLTITYYYSERILMKLGTQAFDVVIGNQLIYPMPVNVGPNVLKPVVGDSRKIYFVSDNDFYYYYYWGYAPQGRYSPYDSWIYKKDLVGFVQGLLDDGYYVVTPEAEVAGQQEILSGLSFAHTAQADGFRVMWK